MNNIEKTIFDSLARRKGINLPGVGSLSVVHIPAEFITDSSLRPPHNKIIFSRSLNPQYDSVGHVKGYETWLQQTVQGRGIREINGVGVLKGTIFYPSAELHDILNPHGTQPVAVKPHYGLKKKIAVGAGVVAAAALVILAVVLIDRFAGEKTRAEERIAHDSELVREEEQGAAARGESTIEAAVAREAARQAEHTTVTETTPPDRPDIAESFPIERQATADGNGGMSESDETPHINSESHLGVSLPAPQVFYLVAGVFSEPDNADRLIARDPLRIGSSNYSKIDFGKGKVLVSAFSSPERDEVERRRRELSSLNRDLWVYEKK